MPINRKTKVEVMAAKALARSSKAEFVGENNNYSITVNSLIREDPELSISTEIGILRETIQFILSELHLTNEQFEKYTAYIEDCKKRAKEEHEEKQEA